MVGVFGKDKKPGHVSDAAELAPVLSNDSYRELVWAFIAAIKNATSNSGIILPDLCEEFSRVLDRCLLARTSIDVSANGTDLRLGPVLQDLSDTLTRAVQQNELETQFQLVTTLANVLDAMNNIKTKGLSREFVHAPLLKELDKIGSGKSTEIRLIHAAKYAYQALLGVPSDESPINALLRLSGAVLSGTGKIAGSVSTMDPSKVLDGMAMLQDIPEMVSSMVGVVKSASESREAMSDGGRLELRRKPRQWYIALRYTDLMIRDGAFTKLTEFLQHVPCRGKVEFLGGVYAQLERAWVLAAKTDGKIGPELAHGSIVDVVDLLSTHNCSFGDRSLLDMWRTAVAMTIGLPHKAPPVGQKSKRSLSSLLKERHTYSYATGCPVYNDRRLSCDLLTQAWLACAEARLLYADEELRQYYSAQRDDRLRIQRVSGEFLSMEHCYINLAIVKKAEMEAEAGIDTQDHWDTFQRSRILENGNYVQLAQIFENQTGSESRRRRLLIRGRAGVGKTTLCKNIVYELTQSPVQSDFRTWAQRYDRVLWLPLRNLSTHNGGARYGLGDLINDEFFTRSPEAKNLSDTLGNYCSTASGGRTLFLLDGLDEVSKLLDSDHRMCEFLKWLLNRPDVIITCRPGCGLPEKMDPPDCELETVGFDPRQLRAYVQNTVMVPEQVQDIRGFLHMHPVLFSLFCIPVQLDALCYSGEDIVRGNSPPCLGKSSTEPATLNSMTAIYRAVEGRLWRKDIAWLSNRFDAESECITQEEAQDIWDPDQVRTLVGKEIDFLQCLAFTGLHDSIVNFGRHHCAEVQLFLKPSLDNVFDEFPAC